MECVSADGLFACVSSNRRWIVFFFAGAADDSDTEAEPAFSPAETPGIVFAIPGACWETGELPPTCCLLVLMRCRVFRTLGAWGSVSMSASFSAAVWKGMDSLAAVTLAASFLAVSWADTGAPPTSSRTSRSRFLFSFFFSASYLSAAFST
ncbi:MAG: hypothetical protein IJ189_05005, partial [Clostridia bacterium]|nr:hypothetical protein [Clostridia bacterium]